MTRIQIARFRSWCQQHVTPNGTLIDAAHLDWPASFHEPTVMRGPRNVGNKCRMAKQRAVRGSSTHPLHRNELRFPAPCDFPLNSISHSIRFPTQFEFPLHSNSRSMRFRSMSSHPSTQLLQVDGCRNKKRSHDCRSQSHPSMTSLSVDLHS